MPVVLHEGDLDKKNSFYLWQKRYFQIKKEKGEYFLVYYDSRFWYQCQPHVFSSCLSPQAYFDSTTPN